MELMTQEEFEKLIDDLISDVYPDYPVEVDRAKAAYAAALARIAALEAERRWIPVSERLPDNQTDVIALVMNRVIDHVYYDSTGKFARTELPYRIIHPTHWMPLPPAPE